MAAHCHPPRGYPGSTHIVTQLKGIWLHALSFFLRTLLFTHFGIPRKLEDRGPPASSNFTELTFFPLLILVRVVIIVIIVTGGKESQLSWSLTKMSWMGPVPSSSKGKSYEWDQSQVYKKSHEWDRSQLYGKVMNGTGPNHMEKSSMGPVPIVRKWHQWDRSQA